jgi:hypothetical protein
MAATTASITIAAGQSKSTVLDLTTTQLTQLMAPDAWTSANITFQVSADGLAFGDLYDKTGVEVIRGMGPARAVPVDPALTSAALYLRLRSGSSTHPVVQDADRTFVCVMA